MAGELLFLYFLIPLITWRLGNYEYFLAKPLILASKFNYAKRFGKFVGYLLGRRKLWYSKNISKEK